MLQTNPLLFDDFSGGITDNFVDAPLNKYNIANNFTITENRKLTPIEGSDFYDSDKPQIPLGNNRIGDLIYLNDDLLVQANTTVYRENGTFWTPILGPTGGSAFSAGDANSVVSKSRWNDHLFLTNDEYSPAIKIYKDDVGTLQLRSGGLPDLASDPILAGTSGGGNSYIYAFYYFYSYKVGTVTFEDHGPTTLVNITDIDSPDANSVSITAIPILDNTGGFNRDITNVKVRIYRTEANAQTLYYVGEVTNGTTVYNDSLGDGTLIGNSLIYTDGGVLENNEPPLSKSVHVANGVGWYGNVKIGTEIIKNRLYQSKVDDPDSVPSLNFLDLDDEILGVSSYLDRVIVLCKRSIYRVDGLFDELGGGLPTYQKISDTYGCISQGSITQTQNGVVFASQEGFTFTDGFDTFKISDGFNKTYKAFVKTDLQKQRIFGTYDSIEGKVWWSVQSSESPSDDVDFSYILDTRYGMRPDSSFTTGGNQDSYAPSCMVFKDGVMLRGDKRGFIFTHSADLLSHPKIDLTKVPADWFREAILYDFITVATSFNEIKYRKFNPKIIIQCDNISNLSLQPVSITDIGTREREITAIRWRGNFIWGDPLFKWGGDEFVWGTAGYIEEMRRFAGDDQRCTYRQIQLKNDYAIITESDEFDTATVDATAKTVTLDDTVANDWPESMGGYFIAFEEDGYTKEYEILLEGVDTITVKDDAGNLTDGAGKKWVIQGFPKDEVLKLLNLTILYALLGQQQQDYIGGSLGGNA